MFQLNRSAQRARTLSSALIAATLGLFSLSSFGQTSNARKTPDDQWSEVLALARPVASPVVDANSRTQPDRKSDATQSALNSRTVSVAARSFYQQNPTHPKAGEARKLEAVAAVRGIVAGDETYAQTAMAVARAYRTTREVPLADRFDVALTMDRMELSRRIQKQASAGKSEEWLQVGELLRREFGDQPGLYTYFMEIANRLDEPTAQIVAMEVNRSSVAPATAKARARVILDRAALIGKPVALKLANIDGGVVDLAQKTGRTTVVVVWSPSDPEGLSPLKPFSQMMPANTQIVYLALGGTVGGVNAAKTAMPLPGWHCHAPAGPTSRAAIEALKTQYGPLPRVYVFTGAGTLASYGPVERFPSLVARASK